MTGARSIRRHASDDDFAARLTGRKITAVVRKGKYLLVKLDAAPPAASAARSLNAPNAPTQAVPGVPTQADILVIHLGMSGQLLRAKSAKEPLEKHTHVVLTLSTGGQLRFVDPRTFGELFVTTPDQIEDVVPELAHLGFDPLDDIISWTHFAELLYARKARLKGLLMDQRFLAGIGNIYADEVLFAAGLRYDRSSETLTTQEVRRLYRAMVETLQDAIKHRGSSLADEQYRDLFGEIGTYQTLHNVYDRAGKPCPRCRTPIVRVKWQGRSTFLCPRCQV